jgi:hypothetical protein
VERTFFHRPKAHLTPAHDASLRAAAGELALTRLNRRTCPRFVSSGVKLHPKINTTKSQSERFADFEGGFSMKRALISLTIILVMSVARAQTGAGGATADIGGVPATGMTPAQTTNPGRTPSQTTTTTPSQSTTTTPSQNTTITPTQGSATAPATAGGLPAVTSSPVGNLPGAPNNSVGSTVNTVAGPCGTGTLPGAATAGTTPATGANATTGIPAVSATVGGASSVIGNTNVASSGAAVTTNTVVQPCVPGNGIPASTLSAPAPTPTPQM